LPVPSELSCWPRGPFHDHGNPAAY
jgi:hypothetical protein